MRTRTGCPGVAASSPIPLMSGNGLPAPAAVAHCGRKIASAASFGKCGTPSGALTGQKHHPAARVADEVSQKIHGRCGSGGWPGPHFFVFKFFFQTFFAADLRGFSRIRQPTSECTIFWTEDQDTLTAEFAEEGPQSSRKNSYCATTLVVWALFGTGFRGASTESLRASQLQHKSFCVSLCVRLC